MLTDTKPTATGEAHRAVWKFILPDTRKTESIPMPSGAVVLSTAFQGDALCIWAIVTVRRFRAYMTGAPIDAAESLSYVGTAHLSDGGSPYVLHVFEVLS